MNDIKKKLQTYRIWIVMLFVGLAAVWIVGVEKKDTTSSAHIEEKYASEALTDSQYATGIFVPSEKHLKSFSFIPNRSIGSGCGEVTVELLDEFGEVVASSTRPMDGLRFGYMNAFPMDVTLVPGDTYTYQILPKDYADYPISVDVATLSCGTGEIRSFSHGGRELENTILLTECTYHQKLSKQEMLPRLLFLFLFAVLLTLGITLRQPKSKVEKGFLWLLVLAIGSLIILMNDEGKKPLVLTGTELFHEGGFEDYREFLAASEENAAPGLLATSNEYMLRKGGYTLQVSYLSASEENSVEVYNDKQDLVKFSLNPLNTYGEFHFEEPLDTQNTEIRFYYSGQGALKINYLKINPDTYFYNDTFYFLALFWILWAVSLLAVCKGWFNKITKKQYGIGFALTVVAIIVSIPLWESGLGFADDLCYHLLRIEGIKDGILDGQIPVVVYPNALSGNGYLNSMYPYLFLYPAAFLRILGVSLPLAYKSLIFLSHIATIGITYYSIRSIKESDYAALFGTCLYLLLPYRYANVYVRGALGEVLAMTFLPLALAGLYHILIGDSKKCMLLLLGFSGLLQSHIISFVVACIIAVAGCILFMKKLFTEPKRLWNLVKAALLTALLNAWFVIPLAYNYLFENLRTESLDWSNFTEYTLKISGLFLTRNEADIRYLSLGIAMMLAIFYGFYHLVARKKEEQEETESFLQFLFVTGCLIVLLITYLGASHQLMNIALVEKLFQMIQFPWRLLAQASCMIILPTCIWIGEEKMETWKTLRLVVLAVVVAMNVVTALPYAKDDHNYAYADYTDTYTVGHDIKVRGLVSMPSTVRYPYEWRINGATEEELVTVPIPTEYLTTETLSYEKQGTNLVYAYSCPTENAHVILPIMSYFGYHVYDENGIEQEFTRYQKCGMEVALNTDGNPHQLIVRFEMPIWIQAGLWISIITLLGMAFAGFQKGRKRVRTKEGVE